MTVDLPIAAYVSFIYPQAVENACGYGQGYIIYRCTYPLRYTKYNIPLERIPSLASPKLQLVLFEEEIYSRRLEMIREDNRIGYKPFWYRFISQGQEYLKPKWNLEKN